ncbi:MAG: hypothetical protein KIT27_01220 [Legionellales bacterium]|nr:hypothetical protein [Legionellales bacterium]
MFQQNCGLLRLSKNPALENHTQLGQQYTEFGLQHLTQLDYKKAYQQFSAAITECGYAPALLPLGKMHETGQKYPHSPELALQYYQLALRHRVKEANKYITHLAVKGFQVSELNNNSQRFAQQAHQQGDDTFLRELLLKGMEYYRQALVEEYQQQRDKSWRGE